MTDSDRNGKRKGKGCLLRIKRFFGGLLVLIIGLLLCGLLYQIISMNNDRKLNLLPGTLVDIGKYRLHLYCMGKGSPTVILEAGLGDNWLTWSLVQEKISRFTRVCAYDRAGLGWSDTAPGPLNSHHVAESLHTLLNNAGIQGPYILVGHSVGGIHVRSFAHLYPKDVVGIVLIDSAHENQFLRYPSEIVQPELENMSRLVHSLSLGRYLAPIGIVRLLGLTAGSAQDKPLPPDQRRALIAAMNRTNYCQTVNQEMETELQESSQTRPLYALGDIPLTVLTVPNNSSAKSSGNLPDGVTKEMAEQADKTFLELQQELAGLSINGRLVIVGDGGHYIQFDHPDLVVDEIRKMVESLQKQ